MGKLANFLYSIYIQHIEYKLNDYNICQIKISEYINIILEVCHILLKFGIEITSLKNNHSVMPQILYG